MKTPDPAPHVIVTWGDAFSLEATEYLPLREVRRYHHPMKSTTTGFLVRRDLHGVTIMAERQEDIENGGFIYRGHTFIPAGMIYKIKVLRTRSRTPKNKS